MCRVGLLGAERKEPWSVGVSACLGGKGFSSVWVWGPAETMSHLAPLPVTTAPSDHVPLGLAAKRGGHRGPRVSWHSGVKGGTDPCQELWKVQL